MELPRGMALWSPWLTELVPELHAAFFDAVTLLERLLGPMPPRPDPGAIEPTGLDGLVRRGSYDRLLLSEWLLADELPDEFLRRAANQEHLFHEIARVTPTRGRRCVVLVDTGPEVLGGPRLAELALLVVLARRAATARAEFSWSSLQDGHFRSDGSFRAFAGLRSARAPSPDDLAHLLAEAGPLGAADEVVFVGGPGIVALAAGRTCISIDEVLEDGADRLRVTTHPAGRRGRSTELVLPSPEDRVRWLRAPFGDPRPTPSARVDHRHAGGPLRPFLRFSTDGVRVLAVEEGGAAVAFRLPEGAAPPKRPLRLPPANGNSRLVALGWANRGLHALFMGEAGRWEWRGSRMRGIPWSGALPTGDPPGELLPFSSTGVDHVWILGASGERLEWRWPNQKGASVARSRCLAIGRRDGSRFEVWTHEGQTTIALTDAGGRTTSTVRPVAATRAVVGAARAPGAGHLVLETARHWHSLEPNDAPLERPTGAVLVGAPVLPTPRYQRGVLWLLGRELWFQSVWPTPEAPQLLASGVRAAAGGTAHHTSLIAWMTEDSTVIVQDVLGRERVRWSRQ